MTALQDWPGIGPIVPRSIKAVIREVWRGLMSEDCEPVEKPQLMGRGLERC